LKKNARWRSTRTLEGDMDWYYESYKAAGQLKKEIDFSADDMILAPVRR
jgi:hypothetical protein